MVLWIELCLPQNSYVEILILSVTVFGKRAFKGIIKVKVGHKGASILQDWCPYKRKR